MLKMSEVQSLKSNQLYYSMHYYTFLDTLRFLIGNNKIAVYGTYTYGFLRLMLCKNPRLIINTKQTHIWSNELSRVDGIKIGDVDYKKLMDVNFLINIYKYFKNCNVGQEPFELHFEIENSLSTIDYKMSFVELIVSKRIIPKEEMRELSTRLNIEELFNLYY